MSTRRQFIRRVTAGGAALALAGCGIAPTGVTVSPTVTAARPRHGGTLTLANAFDVGPIDPTTSVGAIGGFYLNQVHDRLLVAGRDNKIHPGLAERWEIATDQKSLTLFLRKGVNYHDGAPFEAESARWNLDRHLTHAQTAHRGALSSLAGVDIVDTSTIRLRLKAPYAPLLSQLTTQASTMSSRKEIEAQGSAFGSKVHRAGSGPFMLHEIASGNSVTVVRNPNWWGRDEFGQQLPYLDRLVIKVIPDSSVRLTNLRTATADALYDIALGDLDIAKTDQALTVRSMPSAYFSFMLANHKPGMVFSEARLLRAVSMTLDRDELLRVGYAGDGRVGFGPVVPVHFAFDDGFRPFPKPDVDGARSLISQVGKGPLTFEILYTSGDPAVLQVVQLIQAQLRRADITANLRGVPSAQWTAEHGAGSFPGLMYANIGAGGVDPDIPLTNYLDLSGRINTGKYDNKEVQQLLVDQRTTFDESKRRQIIRRIEQIVVVDDPALIWLRFPNNHIVAAKHVRGLEPNPFGRPEFDTTWLDR